ncbi:hypothetical protein [Azospirillum himalayense]|uniref:Uncharacterized protein n=1 Tax=Azospirillum himalayense TaxID=654847 RepID=A0ABW0FZU9_9PROT
MSGNGAMEMGRGTPLGQTAPRHGPGQEKSAGDLMIAKKLIADSLLAEKAVLAMENEAMQIRISLLNQLTGRYFAFKVRHCVALPFFS